jgi:hypothetical protein
MATEQPTYSLPNVAAVGGTTHIEDHNAVRTALSELKTSQFYLIPGGSTGQYLRKVDGSDGNVEWATVSTTGGSARAVGVLVAASNSPQEIKDMADFVCDGVNDQVEINSALQMASLASDALSGSSYGSVELSGGTFFVGDNGSPITMYPNTSLKGQGWGTIIYPKFTVGTTRGAIEKLNTRVSHILIKDLAISAYNLSTYQATAWYGSGIKLSGQETGTNYTLQTGGGADTFDEINNVLVVQAGTYGIWIDNDNALGVGTPRGVRIIDTVVYNSSSHSFFIDDASDAFLFGCKAAYGGTNGSSKFYISGGNVRVVGCKAFSATSATVRGFTFAGGRIQSVANEAQDLNEWGFYITSSDASVSGCSADSCSNGFYIGADGEYSGIHVYPRSGGDYNPTYGVQFANTPRVIVSGKVTLGSNGTSNPTNYGTAHVTGTPHADSDVLIVREGTGASGTLATTPYGVVNYSRVPAGTQIVVDKVKENGWPATRPSTTTDLPTGRTDITVLWIGGPDGPTAAINGDRWIKTS